MSKKIKIVTHNGKFHSDDVFGVAALLLLLGEENCEVFRSRGPKAHKDADYVLDTGFEYNPETNRFDHHQTGRAGARENGIFYASFGLIWKHYGEKICSSKKVAEIIDRHLVQPIDAMDNGIDLCDNKIEGVSPFRIQDIINLHRPTWSEEQDYDKAFLRVVKFAKWVLQREIKKVTDDLKIAEKVEKAYQNTENKEIIVVDYEGKIGREIVVGVLLEKKEPVFAVLYRDDVPAWQVVAVNKEKDTYELRKSLPENWWGKQGVDFSEAAGIPDGIFCHANGFMCVTKSKESAIKLAQLALEA